MGCVDCAVFRFVCLIVSLLFELDLVILFTLITTHISLSLSL